MSGSTENQAEEGHPDEKDEWRITRLFKQSENLTKSFLLLLATSLPIYYFSFPDIKIDQLGYKLESIVLSDLSSSCRKFFRTRKIAEQGNALAQTETAAAYELGECVTRDMAQAKKFYEQAHNRGNAWATVKLGTFYENGTFEAPDKSKAIDYYTKAEAAGEPRASILLGAYFENGDGNLRKPDPAKAAGYYQNAVNLGDPRGYALLGSLYLKGSSAIPRDCGEAMSLLQKGAALDDGRSMMLIGSVKENGCEGSKTDLSEAIEWYKRGADAGDDQSAQHLLRLNVEWSDGEVDLAAMAVHFLLVLVLTAAALFIGKIAIASLLRARKSRFAASATPQIEEDRS